ncbi:3-hydroxyacyl-[acyl-carrier-protein] dehydratase [Mucilaginibacter gracilis]|uniref:3-hydroxyacyl-[acyl-carrier-protein] dehydratase n=1 Tax=Mucilaginibacter gracilis TaxID=423350 RepID=A0A495J630_9SPHI|nr:hydroxymyristoyl-ACP dehydratase [Mucilaginibacter gracilis]RKR83449.1 3-hydroxyacyl-[acyl-carrier-protein] dehydratase [Mucilaginibacter gracilis]
MLRDSLYHIESTSHHDGNIIAALKINAQHDILKGHFPGQPVLPGACMLQITKEVLEQTLKLNLRLKKADHLKFIQLINPAVNNLINININYKLTNDSLYHVTGALYLGETACFKLKGVFISQP